MTHIILAIIYLAFISLGLPDSMLEQHGRICMLRLEYRSHMQVFIPPLFPRGQIISSLLSDRLTLKFLFGSYGCNA